MRAAMLLCALAACNSEALEEFLGPERNCETRQAFYPDADGDGIGEVGAIFFGCSAPAGYTATAPADLPVDTDPPADTDDDSSDTASETGG